MEGKKDGRTERREEINEGRTRKERRKGGQKDRRTEGTKEVR